MLPGILVSKKWSTDHTKRAKWKTDMREELLHEFLRQQFNNLLYRKFHKWKFHILVECILQSRHQKKNTHLQALFITSGPKPKSLPHSVWRYSHVLPRWLSYVLFHPPHRFHTNFDLVSEWLAGANKHLKTLSGLVDVSDLSQECVQSNLIKLLVRLFCVLIK